MDLFRDRQEFEEAWARTPYDFDRDNGESFLQKVINDQAIRKNHSTTQGQPVALHPYRWMLAEPPPLPSNPDRNRIRSEQSQSTNVDKSNNRSSSYQVSEQRNGNSPRMRPLRPTDIEDQDIPPRHRMAVPSIDGLSVKATYEVMTRVYRDNVWPGNYSQTDDSNEAADQSSHGNRSAAGSHAQNDANNEEDTATRDRNEILSYTFVDVHVEASATVSNNNINQPVSQDRTNANEKKPFSTMTRQERYKAREDVYGEDDNMSDDSSGMGSDFSKDIPVDGQEWVDATDDNTPRIDGEIPAALNATPKPASGHAKKAWSKVGRLFGKAMAGRSRFRRS